MGASVGRYILRCEEAYAAAALYKNSSRLRCELDDAESASAICIATCFE